LLLAIAFLFALASPVRSDVVLTKDGRTLEGKIVEEGADALVIETPFGRVPLSRGEVRSIERGPSPWEVYEARRANAAGAQDHFDLAQWCAEKGLTKERRSSLEEAVRLDPDHAQARAALGFVSFEGRWVQRRERDRILADREEKAAREKGLVKHEGRWVTPEEKEAREKGLVFRDGRWMTEEAAARERGLDLYEGSWIPQGEASARRRVDACERATGATLRAVVTEHFLVAGPYEEEFLGKIARDAEGAHGAFDRLFGEGAADAALAGRRAELYLLEDVGEYAKAVDHFSTGNPTVTPRWAELAKAAWGFVLYDPLPISVAVRLARKREDLHGHTLHHVGHVFANLRGYEGRLLPPWYDEGFAALVEQRATGGNAVFCRASGTSPGEYARKGDLAAGSGVDRARLLAGAWRDELARAAGRGELSPLTTVIRRQVSELTLVEVLESMAVIETLEADGPPALSRFHAALRSGMPPAPVRVPPGTACLGLHDAAFREGCGLTVEGVDRRVREGLERGGARAK
jgi:hypothetical protein